MWLGQILKIINIERGNKMSKITVNVPKGKKSDAILALADAVNSNARAIEVLARSVSSLDQTSNVMISGCNIQMTEKGIGIGIYNTPEEMLDNDEEIIEQTYEDNNIEEENNTPDELV